MALGDFVDAIFSNLKRLNYSAFFNPFFFLCIRTLYCQRCEKRITLKGAEINRWPRVISSMAVFAVWKSWNFYPSLFGFLLFAQKRLHCQSCGKRITLKGAESNRWPRGISSMAFFAVWKSWNFYPSSFESFFFCAKRLYFQRCEKRIT